MKITVTNAAKPERLTVADIPLGTLFYGRGEYMKLAGLYLKAGDGKAYKLLEKPENLYLTDSAVLESYTPVRSLTVTL